MIYVILKNHILKHHIPELRMCSCFMIIDVINTSWVIMFVVINTTTISKRITTIELIIMISVVMFKQIICFLNER